MTESSELIDIQGMEYLYNPSSIAIVGASPETGKPGGRPLVALKAAGYEGRIAGVNPNYDDIDGIPCYPTLLDVPHEVEMAIISIPAAGVLNVLRQGVKKGIKSAVIFTAGFAEVDDEGKAWQNEMQELAREHGIRIMGPNCMGLMNLTNSVMATFAFSGGGESIKPATLAFISQSGAFGNMVYQQALAAGVGFSSFASVGNEADAEFADYVHYLLRDPEAQVIGGYIEGARDGRKLRQVAEQALLMGKPIMVLKVGRSGAGARAASSHTGSLAGNDAIYDAFFKQMGIIRLGDLSELTNFVLLHQTGRNFEGTRACILGGSGGHGVRLTDRCEAEGLTVPELTGEIRDSLEEILPTIASARNPIDFTVQGGRDPDLTYKCLKEVIKADNIDVILMRGGFGGAGSRRPRPSTGRRSGPPGFGGGKRRAAQLIELQDSTDKAIVLVESAPRGGKRNQTEQMVYEGGIAALPDGLTAARAVAQLSWYQRKARRAREDAASETPIEHVDHPTTDSLLKGNEQLLEVECKQILNDYGIPVTREELVSTKEDAVTAANQIGYPVVLKIQSRQILHKTEADGIRLNLASDDEVAIAYDEIITNAREHSSDASIDGVLVQQMIEAGTEIIVGTTTDPVFGPVVMFGLGGIFVEVLEDVTFRVAPLKRRDAEEMLDEIKGRKILDGIRGQPPLDREVLIETLLKLSQLVTEHQDRIEELDINPLLLFADGACAIDALITKKDSGL